MFTYLHTRSVMFLRLSLGLVFFWFGVLKLFNASPMLPILKDTFPGIGESQLFIFLLAFGEMLIGLAFLTNRFVKIAAIIMMVTLFVLSVAMLFTQGFDPRFPVLSLVGELVLKNVVLIAAGLVLIAEKTETIEEKAPSKQ